MTYQYCKQHNNTIDINHPAFCAQLSLQGAQLLSFTPKGHAQKDWLWQSPQTPHRTTNSKTLSPAIRAGIPVCFPWFGVNRHKQTTQKHGFARQVTWAIDEIIESTESVKLSVSLDYNENSSFYSADLFQSPFNAKLTITLSDTIHYDFSFTHLGEAPQIYSYAFHTYFYVNDISKICVSGLDKQKFLDNTQALKTLTQSGNIEFNAEFDAVFEGTSHAQVLIQKNDDTDTSAALVIEGQQCPSCIIWNPGEKLAQKMPDVTEQYKQFVCIERGNAFADELELRPQESHRCSMQIYAQTHQAN